jgi:hypothetical protein
MDTSKEYISQCDCPEIQDLCNHEYGDRFAVMREGSLQCLTYQERVRWSEELGCQPKYIFLPRQDQLQEMVIIDNNTLGLLDKFHEYVTDLYYKSSENDYLRILESSFEKLWLAFVMKEKFNKTWKAGKWIRGMCFI